MSCVGSSNLARDAAILLTTPHISPLDSGASHPVFLLPLPAHFKLQWLLGGQKHARQDFTEFLHHAPYWRSHVGLSLPEGKEIHRKGHGNTRVRLQDPYGIAGADASDRDGEVLPRDRLVLDGEPRHYRVSRLSHILLAHSPSLSTWGVVRPKRYFLPGRSQIRFPVAVKSRTR